MGYRSFSLCASPLHWHSFSWSRLDNIHRFVVGRCYELGSGWLGLPAYNLIGDNGLIGVDRDMLDRDLLLASAPMLIKSFGQ